MNRQPEPSKRSELELLLDRIQTGTIEDVEDLEPQDLELLRRHYGNDEELEALLDRLRGTPGDDR